MGFAVNPKKGTMPRQRKKPAYPHEAIGARMRRWREAIGLDGPTLASQVGYSWSGYNKVERGERAPSPELLRQLHELFGVKPDAFLLGDEERGEEAPPRFSASWDPLLAALSEPQRRVLRAIGEAMQEEQTRGVRAISVEEARRVASAIMGFIGPPVSADPTPHRTHVPRVPTNSRNQ